MLIEICDLHDECCLGGRAAVVAPTVHEHGLQILVVRDAGHHLEQRPDKGQYGEYWPLIG